MRTAKEVGAQDVFPIFRKYLSAKANEVESVLADLDRCGDTFKRLDEIPPHSAEGTFVYRWRVLDAQALTPVVLWLFDQDAATLSDSERIKALRAIESFLVRRTVCRLTTKGYNTLYLDLLAKVAEEPSAAGTRVEQYRREQAADARLWPTDGQFTDAFLRRGSSSSAASSRSSTCSRRAGRRIGPTSIGPRGRSGLQQSRAAMT